MFGSAKQICFSRFLDAPADKTGAAGVSPAVRWPWVFGGDVFYLAAL